MGNPYQSPQSELATGGATGRIALWAVPVNLLYVAGAAAAYWSAVREEGLSVRSIFLLAGFLSPAAAIAALRLSGPRRVALLAYSCMASFATSLALVWDLHANGTLGVAAVLVASIPIAMFAVNLFASRPNNSSKPTPLRGAA